MMITSYFSLAFTIMTPMFSPCYFSENIHDKVQNLRELLASKLYENKLGEFIFCLLNVYHRYHGN